MDNLNAEEVDILAKITKVDKLDKGAYNIRKNGKLHQKMDSENINIVKKENQEGIDIFISEKANGDNVFIPVIVTKGDIVDKVYNDFYIEKNAVVNIYAGCAIHNCANDKSEHSGIHRFFVGENAKVKYIENHYGKGSGDKILNPVTEVYLKENSSLELHTNQLEGVNSTVRVTSGNVKKGATLLIRENTKTHSDQMLKTFFDVSLDEEDASCHLVSRAVALDNSVQEFNSKLVGNSKSYAHSECDAIIEGGAKVTANPYIIANSPDTVLVHEATIGKIANDQLEKLMTLGLTIKEAENMIIKGFLK